MQELNAQTVELGIIGTMMQTVIDTGLTGC